MNIYFHIDELHRDAIVASALKILFEDEGHRLVYGNRTSNILLPYFHKAFDVIILPRPHFLYDTWGDNWMNWESRFVMLSAESLGIICKDHQVMARTLLEKEYFEGKRKYVDRIDAFCFWGTKQLQAVKEYAPEILYKCNVVGHPRQDRSTIKNSNSEKNINKSENKKIGILPRAVALNDYFQRSAIDSYSTLFDPHFQYEYYNKDTDKFLLSQRPQTKPGDSVAVQAIDLQIILRAIEALNKSGYKPILRLHPKENLDEWRKLFSRCNLNIEIADNKEPFTHWVTGIDYIIGPPSTSFYDAAMMGVTSISIDKIDARRKMFIDVLWEDNNHLMEYIFRPSDFNSMIEYIKQGEQNTDSQEILAVLKEEANFPDCRNSLDSVVSICNGLNVKRKNNFFYLPFFGLARLVFNMLWNIKSYYQGRKINSAMFLINFRISRWIDILAE
jgi:surface carbohydrate biosynthesis protein